MTDYAIVVGVARYPGFSADGVAADLDGPNNDAQAVRDWLVDPQGGGLDPVNVKLIRSAELDPIDPDDPQPALPKIERELRWIERETRDTAGGRLYLYFSGHGFAPVFEEGALFTAEATKISPTYVYVHAWLRWFRKAQRFGEFVLWMDCCMNSQQTIPATPVPMLPRIGTGVPGPAFVALAAQTNSALEHMMPDGRVHGVFTWTLLKGLAGGASNERGRVTSESLKTFLHNAMPEFFPEAAKKAASVDLQPFVRADHGIVFRRLPARPKQPVRLEIPAAAAGQELRIWTGQPHARVVSEVLTDNQWTGELVRGLYVAEVPAAGVRHGFQVSGAGDVDVAVTQRGPEVIPPDGSDLFRLDVVAENPAAAIAVTDCHFQLTFKETGELHERDAPGVYKIRVEFGRDIAMVSEEVLLLDRDFRRGHLAVPQLPSAALILTHEDDVQSFSVVEGRRDAFAVPAPGISITSRYWTDPTRQSKAQPAFPHPMKGLQLVDSDGRDIAQLSEECQVDDWAGMEPVATWERQVPPGVYFLRQALQNGRIVEGSVVVSSDRITQVAIRRAITDGETDPDAAQVATIAEMAVFMRAAGGMPRQADQDAVIEAARLALAQGRNLFGEGRGSRLQDLLLREYDDPVAGIIGSHLLLLARDTDRNQDSARAELFDTAVNNLRRLVGPGHPDVAALSLRCADVALRATQPFTVPPIFSRSWQLIADASYDHPDLVPAELWQRVRASADVPPFFMWATDETTRAEHTQQLSRWIVARAQVWDLPDTSASTPRSPAAAAFDLGGASPGASPGPLPDAVRDAARRLQIPAAAAAVLWENRAAPQQPLGELPQHA